MKGVFKRLLTLSVLCVIVTIQAQTEKQNKEEVMATIICECLENASSEDLSKDFEKEFNNCHKASVLGALLSGLPTDKDSTITINSDGSSDEVSKDDSKKAVEILEKDCEVFKKYTNQQGVYEEYLTKSTNNACSCMVKIPTGISLEKKNNLISECIVEGVSTSGAREHIDLNTVENIRAFYDDIQRELVESCEVLETVTFSSDEEKLHSYSRNDKAMDFYNQGIDESRNGNFKKAAKYYKKAVALDDKFVFAWDNLGRTYRELHEYDKAIDAYKSSIAIDSLNRTSLMNIAVAYNYKKDFESAELWYTKLKNAHPEDPEGHYGLSLVYLNRSKLEPSLYSAIDAFELYKESKSPYAADAEKVIQYLYTLFEDQNKADRFKEICEERNIKLN